MTNIWTLYDKAAARIPFTLKGRAGEIAVYYGANDDPVKAGFDFLAGLGFDINVCRGYPVVHARIERYEGTGYRTMCGWIQIVTDVFLDSHDRAAAHETTQVSVDVAPSIRASDMPYAAYSNLPQMFDAPCRNLGDHAELHWVADAFLTSVPARSRDEEIEWLAGFRWGYIETDVPGSRPVLLPLEVTDAQVWNSHVPFLRKEFTAWKFRAM